jgi:hypothetical protein
MFCLCAAAAPSRLRAEGTGPAPAVPVDESAAAAEAETARRIRQLEDLVAKLRDEIDALKGQMPSASGLSTIPDLEKQVKALASEIDRLREAATPPPADTSVNGLDPSSSKVYLVKRGLVIGGDGLALYENFTQTKDDDTPAGVVDRADLAEVFLTFGYRFDDRLVFNSRIGVEHAVVEDGNTESAAKVEFAYVDYRSSKTIGARAGLLLIPVGWLNERHASTGYLSVRRPEVEQRIIPTTWSEVGVAAYGEAGPITWRAGVVTSLDAAGFSEAEGVRGGRQQGADARASDLALTGRVDVKPFHNRALGALLVGASGFSGETGQKEPGFPAGRFSLWDLHAEYAWRGLSARALYVASILSDAGDIGLAIDGTTTVTPTSTAIGERMKGWYAEVGYNLMASIKGTKQEVTPFCRYEGLNSQDEVTPGFSADPANDLTVKTCGVRYLPIPNVALKLDYQNLDQQAHTAVDQFNLGVGWSF